MYLDIVTHTVTRLTDRGPAGYASIRRLGSTSTAKEEPTQCISFPVSIIMYMLPCICSCVHRLHHEKVI